MVSGLSVGVFVVVFGIGLYGYAVVTDEPPEMRRAVLACTVGSAATGLRSVVVPALGGGTTIERFFLVGTVFGYGLSVHYLMEHYDAYRYVLPR